MKKTVLHIDTKKTLRNEDHFKTQLTYKHTVVKPKKGKGSFKRDKRVTEEE